MNYARKQNKLFQKMGDQAMRVMFAVNAKDPSLAILRKRHAAAIRLADLATELEDSIAEQVREREK